MVTSVELLQRTRAILLTQGWAPVPVGRLSPVGERCCLLNALSLAGYDLGREPTLAEVESLFGVTAREVMEWNDQPGMTEALVLAYLAERIRALAPPTGRDQLLAAGLITPAKDVP